MIQVHYVNPTHTSNREVILPKSLFIHDIMPSAHPLDERFQKKQINSSRPLVMAALGISTFKSMLNKKEKYCAMHRVNAKQRVLIINVARVASVLSFPVIAHQWHGVLGM